MNAFAPLPVGDLSSLRPELLLAGMGVLILLLDALLPRWRYLATPLTVAALFGAALASGPPAIAGLQFGGLLEATPLTWMATQIILLTALISVLTAHAYLRREGIFSGEYHALFLWCVVGLILMARARELLTVFLALELLSICLYGLAGFHRRIAIVTEAALKYFVMGAFASAFVLYGVALIYGETGSTRFAAILGQLDAGFASIWPVSLGLVLLLAGFAFKMSLVPFHAWAPDAYQGAPTPFVAFLSVAPKVASAIVLLRVLQVAMAMHGGPDWGQLVAGLSVASMIVGNVLALVQRDIKRMLAYSGIAHMGYLLLPLVTMNADSWRAVLVYLLAYALMNAGAFAVIAILYRQPGEQHLIGEIAGWGYRFPLLGACLTICMLSLGGIPPMLGFLGKYLVFLQAIQTGHLGLVLVGVITSLIGVYYYLRVVYTLYMKAEARAPEGLRVDLAGRSAVVLAAAGTVLLGIWPAPLLEWLMRAIRVL
jgi:NADH-quinone oxidoreductase subunit N